MTTVGSGFDDQAITADFQREVELRVSLNQQQRKDLKDIAKRALQSDDPKKEFLLDIHRYTSLIGILTQIEQAVTAVAGRHFLPPSPLAQSTTLKLPKTGPTLAERHTARLVEEIEAKMTNEKGYFYASSGSPPRLRGATIKDFVHIAKEMPEFSSLRGRSKKLFLKGLYFFLIRPDSAADPKVQRLASIIKHICIGCNDDLETIAKSLARALLGEKPSFLLDLDSVADVFCQEVDEVMVYGFKHAHYKEVHDTLLGVESPFTNVFDWNERYHGATTRRGEKMERISDRGKPESPDRGTNRENKGSLIDLAFENYKRKCEGLPFIPLLFCLHSNTADRSFSPTPEGVCKGDLFTNEELRRLYRLERLFARSSHPELREIADIVRETTCMVHVDQGPDGVFRLIKKPSPWDDPSWDRAWEDRAARKRSKGEALSEEAKQDLWWRRDLRERMVAYKSHLTETGPGDREQFLSRKGVDISRPTSPP